MSRKRRRSPGLPETIATSEGEKTTAPTGPIASPSRSGSAPFTVTFFRRALPVEGRRHLPLPSASRSRPSTRKTSSPKRTSCSSGAPRKERKISR